MYGVVFAQLFEKAAVAFLDSEEKQREEIEEGQRRKHADAGFGGVNGLNVQRGVGGREGGCERREGADGARKIAKREVREDGAGSVEGGKVGRVEGVPLVVEGGEYRC